MATLRVVQHVCRRCRMFFASHTSPRVLRRRQKLPTNFFGVTLVVAAHCQAKQTFVFPALDSSTLTPEYLLKSGAGMTADSVAVLISQTEHAILETERKYMETVKTMIKLVEHHLSVLGNKEEEDTVWDVILQGRDRLHTCGKKLEELRLLFTFVQKLTDASIEAASLTGCEETCSSLHERLHLAKERLEKSRLQKCEIEKQLQELQAHSIKVVAEHAEEEEKKERESGSVQ